MEPTSLPKETKSRFKPSDTEINNAEPFASDCLNRRNEIENLTTLLANSEPPLVLAIDAPWGSGKTTFMKMWRGYLSNEFPSWASAYFSAWETDLSDDPLNVFLGEINEQLASKTSGMTLVKWNKAVSLAGKITRRALPALAKIATYGALDLPDAGKEIERALAELSGGIVSDGLETYKASVSAIKQFKENLASVLQDIGKDHPVVVFVDELDRCRPQYAITLLERIKHLLSLPGIIFVLGIDRSQLANAICGAYGDRFDSETYLQRFIDLDYRLSFGDSKAFVSKLVTDYGLATFFASRTNISRPYITNESENLIDTCADLASLFGLQLREVEQLLARVNIVARSTEPSQPIYPHLLVLLLALRAKEPSLYSSLTNAKAATIELLMIITQELSKKPISDVDNIGISLACLITAISDRNPNDPGIAHVTARSTETTDISAAERELMSSVVLRIRAIGAKPSMRIAFDNLIKRIEMAQSFCV